MLDVIRSFITNRIHRPSSPGDTSPPEGVRVAASALLLELAHADGEFSSRERDYVEGALARHFGVDEATTTELIELAERARAQAVDQFHFTQLIVEQYDLAQRMLLAEVMWGVILADGRISEHEAYLIRKLGNLLDLEPGYLAAARRAASGET
ncbi:MAG TPA: TerB family tellurite resistance protein [Gemmatimonadales bacterium]|nr:TerB family tellurite resistance protein [Gemmatimonadales bacterium]